MEIGSHVFYRSYNPTNNYSSLNEKIPKLAGRPTLQPPPLQAYQDSRGACENTISVRDQFEKVDREKVLSQITNQGKLLQLYLEQRGS